MSQQAKIAAATRALEYVKDGEVLGIGTGSTAEAFIEVFIQSKLKPAAIVSSSQRSTEKITAGGFQVVELNQAGPPDVYIDGADECTNHFNLIKGGGGALTLEKLIAAAARKFVVIVDESKLVKMLGKFPVAVEVLVVARSQVARKLAGLGGTPTLRDGFTTDAGNLILDTAGLDLRDAALMETKIKLLAGVVDCGICALRLADVIIIGDNEKLLRS